MDGLLPAYLLQWTNRFAVGQGNVGKSEGHQGNLCFSASRGSELRPVCPPDSISGSEELEKCVAPGRADPGAGLPLFPPPVHARPLPC